MAEQNQQSPSTEQDTSATKEAPQSLEQVYSKFNVEETAQTFQPQPQTQTQQQPKTEVAVPDPVLDSEGFKKFQSNQNQSIQQALTSLHGELTAVRVERQRAGEEADIKNAVQRFRSVTGEDIDEDMAEVALGQKARKDPKFMSVYQNRHKNPAAWNAAVSAYANEFKAKAQFKIDPSIAENQRAAKASIGSQVRQNQDEVTGDDAQFKGKTGKEFAAAWRNYIDRG